MFLDTFEFKLSLILLSSLVCVCVYVVEVYVSWQSIGSGVGALILSKCSFQFLVFLIINNSHFLLWQKLAFFPIFIVLALHINIEQWLRCFFRTCILLAMLALQ